VETATATEAWEFICVGETVAPFLSGRQSSFPSSNVVIVDVRLRRSGVCLVAASSSSTVTAADD